jgi:hypothetical protein
MTNGVPMLDLDALDQRCDAADRHETPLHVPAFEMRALVAELRAARAVVELARRPAHCDPGLLAVEDWSPMSEALIEYDEVVARARAWLERK